MRYWKTLPITKNYRVGIGIATYLNGPDGQRRYHQLSCLLSSLRAQTWVHWHARIVHDGPIESAGMAAAVQALTDAQVQCTLTEKRLAQFGHPHRQKAIDLLAPTSTWIGLTNDDNYYAPVYFEWLLHAAEKVKADFVYADMVHSHKKWKPMTTLPRRGKIDLGGFLVRSDLCQSIPFDKTHFAADADWVGRLVAKAKRVEKVAATLFVHN